jgi:hypothetical protein
MHVHTLLYNTHALVVLPHTKWSLLLLLTNQKLWFWSL